jgi:AraC-like DNA-binding protein
MNKKINRYAKKLKAINHLGGFCSKCGEDNFFKLTFHHKENKEYKLSEIKEYRWSIIEKEINKCDLLCHNCHREHHHIENEDSWNRKAKLNLLDLYGVNYCEECGYDKCLSSLSFHHIRNKKITIGSLTYKLKDGFSSDDMVIKSIVNEFDNCSLLCVNCHLSKHGDVKFFNDNIELIKNKSNLIKEVRSKIDRNDILIKYNSGLSQSDIAKELGCSRGTICDIFKELKIK